MTLIIRTDSLKITYSKELFIPELDITCWVSELRSPTHNMQGKKHSKASAQLNDSFPRFTKLCVQNYNLFPQFTKSCASVLYFMFTYKTSGEVFLTDSEQIMAEFSVRLNYSVAETGW